MISCVEELDELIAVLRRHGVTSYKDDTLSLKLDPNYLPLPSAASNNEKQGDANAPKQDYDPFDEREMVGRGEE